MRNISIAYFWFNPNYCLPECLEKIYDPRKSFLENRMAIADYLLKNKFKRYSCKHIYKDEMLDEKKELFLYEEKGDETKTFMFWNSELECWSQIRVRNVYFDDAWYIVKDYNHSNEYIEYKLDKLLVKDFADLNYNFYGYVEEGIHSCYDTLGEADKEKIEKQADVIYEKVKELKNSSWDSEEELNKGRRKIFHTFVDAGNWTDWPELVKVMSKRYRGRICGCCLKDAEDGEEFYSLHDVSSLVGKRVDIVCEHHIHMVSDMLCQKCWRKAVDEWHFSRGKGDREWKLLKHGVKFIKR